MVVGDFQISLQCKRYSRAGYVSCPLAARYPFYTPYQYAGNKPITKIDRDGLEETGKSPQNNGVKRAGKEDKTYTTPGGQNITIPWSQYPGGRNIERTAPQDEIRGLEGGNKVFVEEGALTEFEINGVHYQSAYAVSGDKSTFVGYRDQNGNFFNPENGSKNATDLGGGQAGNNASDQSNGSTNTTNTGTSETATSTSDSAVTERAAGTDSTATPSLPSANNSDPIGDYYDPETAGFVLGTTGGINNVLGTAAEIAEQSSTATQVAKEASSYAKISAVAKWTGRIGNALTVISVTVEVAGKLADTHTFVDADVAIALFTLGIILGASLPLIAAAFVVGIAASVASDWIDEKSDHWGRKFIYGH